MTGRNVALDGLRGLAAMSVVFYHSILSLNPDLLGAVLMGPIQHVPDTRSAIAKLLLAACSGHMAVMVFFVLSGFVLRLSLERMSGSPFQIFWLFGVRRMFRLYPAMFLCVGVTWLLHAVASTAGLDLKWGIAPDSHSALRNALLIDVDWIGVAWTIQAEVLAVPFILLFFFLSRIFGVAALLACLIYCLFAMEVPALLLNVPRMAAVLPAMCAGMIAADSAILPWFARAPRWCPWLLATSAFLSMVFFQMSPPLTDFARAVIAACLIGTAYCTKVPSAFVQLLTCAPIRFLGKVSYSLYLLNVPIFILLGALGATWGLVPLHRLDIGVALGIVTIVATIPVAFLSERFVEQGGIALGNWVANAFSFARASVQFSKS
ncbi:peptidoglycan/LPS O-acetylase OafA/YrhL [Bradyrhizobium sp. USDA 4529]